MNLASQLTAAENRGISTRSEEAQVCCRLAKQLEKAGEYEAAREALGKFWPEHDDAPQLEGLDQLAAAQVLLSVGVLAGWLGSAHQVERSQETAKNLITQSIEIFEQLGQRQRVAEARGELGLCYWREGSFDEARITLANALSCVTDEDSELKALLLIRAGIVELWAQRLDEALRLYAEAALRLEKSDDHALRGAFHNERALLFRRLGRADSRNDYLDRALIEFAAASFHFEQAGHQRYWARVENNLGELFVIIGRPKEAYGHLTRARSLFRDLHDVGAVAQVDDTCACALLAEQRYPAAERVAHSAVKTLEQGDEWSVLAGALTTYGTVLARTGRHDRSRSMLDRAIEAAENCGDLEAAGRARLTIIEEFSGLILARELAVIYQDAVDVLKKSQDPSTKDRLIAAAGKVVEAFCSQAERPSDESEPERGGGWEGFSLKREVLAFERSLVLRALRDAGGSVTSAAKLLGLGHQGLSFMLNTRHKNLCDARRPRRVRRRSIIGGKKRKAPSTVENETLAEF